MFSVILPTMWRGRGIDIMFHKQKLLDSPAIGEVILIDNDADNTRPLPYHAKLKYLPQKQNIYVNPAWNLGVSIAAHDQICLMSDDTIFDVGIFEQMVPYANTNTGIIGLGPHCDVGVSGNITPRKVDLVDAPGCHPEHNEIYGMLMFFHKDAYTPIPNELKIFLGDTWIFAYNALKRRKPNKYMHQFDVLMTKNTTSFRTEVRHVAENDVYVKDDLFDNYFNDGLRLTSSNNTPRFEF